MLNNNRTHVGLVRIAGGTALGDVRKVEKVGMLIK